MPNNFYRRFGPLLCCIALAAAPLLLYGAVLGYASNSNNVADWLPESFEETQKLRWFLERFVSDEILVVSWPDCTLDDPRLDQVAEELLRPQPSTAAGQSIPLIRKIHTGRKTLNELADEPLNLSRPQAMERMNGWLVGADGHTCLIALVTYAGSQDRHAILDAVYRITGEIGIPREEVRVAGPTADSVAIDVASQQLILELSFVSAGIGIVIAWWCMKIWRLVASVFITSTFCWAASVSVVYYRGVNMDAVLLVMPALVYVLAVSGAVHLANYYKDALRHGASDPPWWAISHGWLPCTLACITTAIGLGSLTVSQVTPIKKFGTFAAVGTMVGLFGLLVLWPSVVHWWLSRYRESNKDRAPEPDEQGEKLHWWTPFYRLATGHCALVLAAAALLMPACAYGVSHLKTAAQLENLLPEKSELIQSYSWLQDRIGPMTPVEIVLKMEPLEADDARGLLDRADMVERLRQRLDELDAIGGSVAATTFTVEMPKGGGLNDTIRRAVISRRLARHRDDLVQAGYIYDDRPAGETLWRISSRVHRLQNVEYGALLNLLDTEVRSFLKNEGGEDGAEAEIEICGSIPLVYMAQRQLLRDLIKSFGTAFLLILVPMTLLMRNLLGGLISMIPNVFPAVVVFGAMGLTGNAVDIGAMMTASVALGIAVDDTLHFLVWYRRGLEATATRRDAVRFAYGHCATPMLQTSAICGLGLLVLVFSPFLPIQRFAYLMCTLLFIAVVGDLILLPALLVSPLGRFFVPKASVSEDQSEQPAVPLVEHSGGK